MISGRRVRVVYIVAFLFTHTLSTAAANGQAGRLSPADEHFVAGFELQQAGEHEKALEAYRKALEIKPTFTRALYEQGLIYFRRGNYAGTIESMRKVLQSEPTHVYALHGLGMAYATTGDKTAAMQQYHILKDLNADIAADLLRAISK